MTIPGVSAELASKEAVCSDAISVDARARAEWRNRVDLWCVQGARGRSDTRTGATAGRSDNGNSGFRDVRVAADLARGPHGIESARD